MRRSRRPDPWRGLPAPPGLLRLLCLGLLLGGPQVATAQPLFDGSAADVWVLGADGQPVGHGTGRASHTTAALRAGDTVEIHTAAGDRLPFAVPAERTTVLVNDTVASWPPLGPATPPLALVGLDGPLFGLDSTGPTAVVAPAAGTYPSPLQVAIRALAPPGAGGPQGGLRPLTLSIRTNNGPPQAIRAAEHLTTLVGPGEHVLIISALVDGLPGRPVEARFTLTGARGADTDGDGVPDAVELAFGGDPFTADRGRRDTDGDGYSDFDEWLRGTDPGDANRRPRDTDQDGWPDLDEGWRRTDPEDAGSFPAARSLAEAEVEVQLQPDARLLDLGAGARLTLRAAVGEDDDAPVRAADGQAAPASWEARAVPVVRLPAHAPGFVRLVSAPPQGPVHSAAKIHLPTGADPFTAALASVPGDLAPEAWRTAVRAALTAQAVPRTLVRFGTSTSAAVALAERTLAIASETPATLVLLADPASEPRPGAVAALAARYAPFADGADPLDAFVAHLRARLRAGAPFGEAAELVEQVYARPVAVLARPLRDRSLAVALRDEAAAAERLRYRAHLLLAYGPGALDRASARLLDPDGDADGDGRPNADELAAGTHPDLADSDGDGGRDDRDPCPLDATDACRDGAQASTDTDGDGVPDGLDDCPNVADPAPVDADGDGISDACGRAHYALIAQPAWHPTVRVGDTVVFTGRATGLARGNRVSATWRFDGAAPDARDLGPVSVRFAAAGTYTVRLEASIVGGAPVPADTRTVTVLGPEAPVLQLSIARPASAVEGSPVRLRAAVRGAVAPIVHWRWQLGDGATAEGARPEHTWRREGTYAVQLDVHDARGGRARAVLDLTVADAVPEPDLAVRWLGGGRFRFTDRGHSHDPVARRQWDLGDGTVRDGGAVLDHTYAAPGERRVRLAVTDADGSVAEAHATVQAPDACADVDGDGLCAADDPCPETYDPEATDLDGDARGDACAPPDCATGLHVCQRVAEGAADLCLAALDTCRAECAGRDAGCGLACATELERCRAEAVGRHQRCVGDLPCAGARACVVEAGRCGLEADRARSACHAGCFKSGDPRACQVQCDLAHKRARLRCRAEADPRDADGCPPTVACLDACRGARTDCRAAADDAAFACRVACRPGDAGCLAGCGARLATAQVACRDADDDCARGCLDRPCNPEGDADGDGLNDCVDPCPDGRGTDLDADGVCDRVDHCAERADAAQLDPAGRGVGPRCESEDCAVVHGRCALAVAAQEAACLAGTFHCPAGCVGQDCAVCAPEAVARERAACAVASVEVAALCGAVALTVCGDAQACDAAVAGDAAVCAVAAKRRLDDCIRQARGNTDRLATCDAAFETESAACEAARRQQARGCAGPAACAAASLATFAQCDRGAEPGRCLGGCLAGEGPECPPACLEVDWNQRAACVLSARRDLEACP